MTPAAPAPAVAAATSVAALVDALVTADPGRPRVTWYGPGGERVELSSRVLANWVAKTGNLLVEECGVEPGDVVRVDLPMHWRAVACALGAWAVGASVQAPGAGPAAADGQPAGARPAALVTDRPASAPTSAPSSAPTGVPVVAVALPALARGLPAGTTGWDVDYAAEVAGFADVLLSAEPDADDTLTRARAEASAAGWPPGARVLVGPAAWQGPRTALAALAVDGSVVLVGDDRADVDALARTEQVDVRAG
ncbi:TIGR03089 family protein [Thalassiella azotivora]